MIMRPQRSAGTRSDRHGRLWEMVYFYLKGLQKLCRALNKKKKIAFENKTSMLARLFPVLYFLASQSITHSL